MFASSLLTSASGSVRASPTSCFDGAPAVSVQLAGNRRSRPQANRRVGMVSSWQRPFGIHPRDLVRRPQCLERELPALLARQPPQLRQRRDRSPRSPSSRRACSRYHFLVSPSSCTSCALLCATRSNGGAGRQSLRPQPPDPAARLVPGVARIGVIHPDVAPIGDVDRAVGSDRRVDRPEAAIGGRHQRVGVDRSERRAVGDQTRRLDPAGERHARNQLPLVPGQLSVLVDRPRSSRTAPRNPRGPCSG